MKKIKLNLTIGIFLVLIILLSSLVFAFGVSSSYWEGKPFVSYPGAEETISLGLQNVEENDELIKAEITAGKEIASLEKTEYLVKAGTIEEKVPIKIKIPEDIALETKYPITVSFKTVTQGRSGAVTMGTGYSTTFDVLVHAKPEEIPVLSAQQKTNYLNWMIIATVVIAIVIILIVLKRRKQE